MPGHGERFQQLAPNARVSLVYCGVDLHRFNPAPAKANHSYDKDNRRRLLFIGRLCQTKGLFTLMRALKLLPTNLRPDVDIVGDGYLKSDLKHYIGRHGLTENVHLLDARQSSWIVENAHKYAALVAPFELAPNGDRDTGPVVVKEAMALKLPVITTEFMGCKEMITEDCGIKVAPGDPAALAQAIKRFYQMSARADRDYD